MLGGNPKAWPHIAPIFQAICAKVDNGDPCCDWVGETGSGHFVKMVHNGIEYGDMQVRIPQDPTQRWQWIMIQI